MQQQQQSIPEGLGQCTTLQPRQQRVAVACVDIQEKATREGLEGGAAVDEEEAMAARG
jgi:hypothetical protein